MAEWKTNKRSINLSQRKLIKTNNVINEIIMAIIEKIHNGLIDKILTIRNEDFLLALDNLISTSATETNIINLTAD